VNPVQVVDVGNVGETVKEQREIGLGQLKVEIEHVILLACSRYVGENEN
jgi:hypothetical protein